MEWRFPVTALGLIADIVGAWVIASAVIATAKGARDAWSTETAIHDSRREGARAKVGAIILTAGFLLQLIASIPQ